ncbi:DTW domain-containing protein [Shewanella zhangzhouensis]|nr:DTW domain-containing protein [Shewanella zhangzhouensis]
MSRDFCVNCHFPLRVCVCDAISPVAARTRVWVLKHPSEVEHGKNSARLLPLILDTARIFVGESEADFAALRQQLEVENLAPVLVYPADEGEEFSPSSTGGQPDSRVLLLLDGTWRKALKMYHLNPWLHGLPKLSFTPDTPSAYRIRKASRSDSLSTLEAAACALECLEPELDTGPMLQCFDAMISRRLEAMPEAVRQRYLADSESETDR